VERVKRIGLRVIVLVVTVVVVAVVEGSKVLADAFVV